MLVKTLYFADDGTIFWLMMQRYLVTPQRGVILEKGSEHWQSKNLSGQYPYPHDWLRRVYLRWADGTSSKIIQLSLNEPTLEIGKQINIEYPNGGKRGVVSSRFGERSIWNLNDGVNRNA